MLASFLPAQPQRVLVGNINDLQSVKVTDIGGVPVEELQKSVKGLRGARITGFPVVRFMNDSANQGI